MATFLFFNSLSYGLPLAHLIAGPFGILTLVMLIFMFAYLFLSAKDRSHGWTAMFVVVQQMFGDSLKKDEVDGHRVYSLYGIPLARWTLISMFVSVLGIYFCTLVSFWSDFIFSESSQCDEELSCFALDPETFDAIQQEPLGANCTAFEAEGYTIRCYSLALDYVTAIGNAGSVIVVAALIMNVQGLLSSGGLYLRSNNTGYRRIIITVVIILYYCATVLTLFLVPILLVSIIATREAVLNTDASYVQFFAYYFTLLYAYLSSGPLFIIRFSRDCYRRCDFFVAAPKPGNTDPQSSIAKVSIDMRRESLHGLETTPKTENRTASDHEEANP